MEKLSKLSAKYLTYYVHARRWKSELDFFTIEVDFYMRIFSEELIKWIKSDQLETLKQQLIKLTELINEKHKISELLEKQLQDLELMAENMLLKSEEEIAKEQVNLEYLMNDLIHEFRETKKILFKNIEYIIAGANLKVN
jgi:SMC interacting uncharacterized protein involved in chromosome segregation